jgi:phospholipid/cholesterol/gamma-HCH transport system permease protein
MPKPQVPTLAIQIEDGARSRVALVGGAWQVQPLAQHGILRDIEAAIAALPADGSVGWDLNRLTSLDHFGAQVLWNAWGRRRPARLVLPEHWRNFFDRIEQAGPLELPEREGSRITRAALRQVIDKVGADIRGFILLIGQLMLDLLRFAGAPQRGPWKEISASIFHAGYQALGITALVGFLIGVVLSYLSAQQLHAFGGDVYLVNLLGMGIIRELGPLLAAILVAGRSGSSITAQLGVMRVTEELDAMLVMGMPHGFRLIMPRVVALAAAMPLLVIWTDAMALLGGIAAANVELNLSPTYFFRELPNAVPLANYYIGLGKGVVFGALIALVACYFGLRIKANTDSLGRGTTTSVVSAITVVILADAVFAIVFNGVGFT